MAGKQADIKVGVVTNYDDKGLKQAQTGLAGFKTAVSEADGFTGKLKAGFSSLGTTITDKLSGPLGIAAVGGIFEQAGEFALGAVSKFSTLGVEIGKLHDSTGLLNTDASRWIEVAGDIGIPADALEGSLGKLNKTAGATPGLFKDAGIEIAHTKDGAVDVNQTFLNTIDVLNGMRDPQKKAELAAKLLGKGWQSMAELIGQGSGKLKQSLADVASAKVFDDDKVQKARDFRKATDELKDVMEEFTIQMGTELAPALADVAQASAKVLGLWAKMETGAKNVVAGIKEWVLNTFDFGAKDADTAEEAQRKLADQTAETAKETRKLASGMGEIHDREQEAADAADHFKDVAAASLRDVQAKVDALQAKWDELHSKISNEQSMIKYKQQVEDVKKANEEAWQVTAEKGPGSPDSIAAIEDARLKTLDLEDSVATYGQTVLGLPPEQVTNIIAAIDQGNLDSLPDILQGALDSRTYRISAHLDSIVIDGETHAAGAGGPVVVPPKADQIKGAKAAGGPVTEGNWLVGENGPEVVHMGGNGTVIPNNMLASGGNTINLTVNAGLATDGYRVGQQIVNALNEWKRRNGG